MGGYGSESGWSSTGGGLSADESAPSYQGGVNTTSERSTPDVGFVADPATGVSVYSVPPSSPTSPGQWSEVGGTSIGAPAWAGLIAIADQGRSLAGEASLTGATQTVPALYSLLTSAFYKVPLTPSGGLSTANTVISTANYNTQAGLGSPAGSVLVSALVKTSITAPAPTPTPVASPAPTPVPIRLQPPVHVVSPVSTPTATPIIPVIGPNPTPLPTPTPSPTPPPAASPMSSTTTPSQPVSHTRHKTRPHPSPSRHRPKASPHRTAGTRFVAGHRGSAVVSALIEDRATFGPAGL